MKAIIYTRVSKSSQSTQRQVSDLSELNGYDVVRIFSESISGYTRSAFERPELQKAIQYAKENDVEVILIHEISRLGRRTSEVLAIIEDLKQHDIKIFVKSLDLLVNSTDARDGYNKFLITLMTDIGRMESEQMSFRIKSGLEQRKRNGYAIGRRYGSTESTETFLSKHKKVVRYLNNGESVRWIATKLNMSPTTVQKVRNYM
jgi:DNA invertase Pin-like site-specific DNA recombinase